MVEINHDMDAKELLREILELTRETNAMTKKIRNHITFQKIVSFIYFIVIVGPIILGFIFLPPLLKNVFGQYQELLGPGASGNILNNLLNNSQNTSTNTIDLKNVDMKKLPPEIQKLLQKK